MSAAQRCRLCVVALAVSGLAGCAGTRATAETPATNYELTDSHPPLRGTRLDYVYWESYLLQHGNAQTVRRFEELTAAAAPADAAELTKSFERFCRFQGCLQAYREMR